ncbi:MAG TPA: hypothetical protein VLB04_08160 [Methanotrichaceae archaeon]|nr:hypothetical protein [Methanotrichaceae archaeon]
MGRPLPIPILLYAVGINALHEMDCKRRTWLSMLNALSAVGVVVAAK